MAGQSLIALTGLVRVEKLLLAAALVRRLAAAGHGVTLLDNVSGLSLDVVVEQDDAAALPDDAHYMRLTVDLTQYLPTVLPHVETPVVVAAISEHAHPEALFSAIDEVAGWSVCTVAMVDARTCDCFPQLRILLEDYADLTCKVPCTADWVLRKLGW
ncbi:MAG: hypothetical protein ACOCYT_00090 [Chloroflexota bacterium]